MTRDKPLIKIRPSNLREKSNEELLEVKKQIEFHLLQARHPKHIGDKGFNIIEEKKNIARINTILHTRKALSEATQSI